MPILYFGTLGTVGIILLLTGLIIVLVTRIRGKTNTGLLDVKTAIYFGIGMVIVGIILLLVQFATSQ